MPVPVPARTTELPAKVQLVTSTTPAKFLTPPPSHARFRVSKQFARTTVPWGGETPPPPESSRDASLSRRVQPVRLSSDPPRQSTPPPTVYSSLVRPSAIVRSAIRARAGLPGSYAAPTTNTGLLPPPLS